MYHINVSFSWVWNIFEFSRSSQFLCESITVLKNEVYQKRKKEKSKRRPQKKDNLYILVPLKVLPPLLFEQGALHYHFTKGLTNYVAHSASAPTSVIQTSDWGCPGPFWGCLRPRVRL